MAPENNETSDNEVSSPACAMHEADDAYMGYASKDELIVSLNELLEAERAGARVTLESARAAEDEIIAALMHTIQKDEAHWCAMLTGHIKLLGGIASPATDAFHGKAMAITDLSERVTFLNRGQGWVVRKLKDLLPRTRDARLHKDLSEMLVSHEANIALAENRMADVARDRTPPSQA